MGAWHPILGKGGCLQGTGKQESRAGDLLRRAALQWVLGCVGLVTAGAQLRSGCKARLAFGVGASVLSQRQRLGWRAAGAAGKPAALCRR